MLQQKIELARKPIRGSITIPGSKSITNRALLLAALREGETILHGVLRSDDSIACMKALEVLGVEIEGLSEDRLKVKSHLPFRSNVSLDCRNAGTVARFLIPILAGLGGEYQVYASLRMSERPMKPLFDALISQGVEIEYLEKSGFLPIRLKSKGLKGGTVDVDIKDSSQFLSGLLLAQPYAKTPLSIQAKDLDQKPYVEMTRKMQATFDSPYFIEPDASTASYFFAAAALTGGEIFIPHLRRRMLQGDIRFLDVLEKMGASVIEKKRGILLMGPEKLKAIGEIDMTGFTDTFMTLAALAPFADGPSRISGLRHTRLQESDRVAAMAEGLSRLGAEVETTEDSLTVYPGILHGGLIDSHNDHRIAMSHALIGLKVEGVIIDGADCVKKTCPAFFKMLRSLSVE